MFLPSLYETMIQVTGAKSPFSPQFSSLLLSLISKTIDTLKPPSVYQQRFANER